MADSDHIYSSDFDLKVALGISVSPLICVWLFGELMFMGFWYYLAIPAVVLGVEIWFQPKPLFLTGVSLGFAITYFAYMFVSGSKENPDGLLALGHLFSLPGLALGILAGAFQAKYYYGAAALLLLGFMTALGGFFINQLVVCNTVMWCGGSLSFFSH